MCLGLFFFLKKMRKNNPAANCPGQKLLVRGWDGGCPSPGMDSLAWWLLWSLWPSSYDALTAPNVVSVVRWWLGVQQWGLGHFAGHWASLKVAWGWWERA